MLFIVLPSAVMSSSSLLESPAIRPGGVTTQTLLPARAAVPKAGEPFGGSLTLLAVDSGPGLSTHSTPHDAVLVCLQGAAEVDLGGATHALVPGDALHMDAGAPHAVRAANGQQCRLLLAKARAASS